ncbi:hypothetical protein MHK_011006 [Candidatus Magnetomorum sp. HK-1]|nr:hypothetical protein MHK_011006 [Candidatus Magnetomorum sp. HK-1]
MFKQIQILLSVILITSFYGCINANHLLEMQSRLFEEQKKMYEDKQKTIQAQSDRKKEMQRYEDERIEKQNKLEGCQYLYEFYKKGYDFGLSSGRNKTACSSVGKALYEEINKASNSKNVGAVIASVTAAGCMHCSKYQRPVSFDDFQQNLCK